MIYNRISKVNICRSQQIAKINTFLKEHNEIETQYKKILHARIWRYGINLEKQYIIGDQKKELKQKE
jgi:hypothetical protein